MDTSKIYPVKKGKTMNNITPEQAGISTQNIIDFLKKIEDANLSTHNITKTSQTDKRQISYNRAKDGRIGKNDYIAQKSCKHPEGI